MHVTEGLLYSIALLLRPEREGTIRATMGHQVHSAFLKTIRRADKALADVLHHPSLPIRPFTVSPLLDLPPARNRRIAITPDQTYTLRFTVLLPEIFQQFMNRFLHGSGRPTLRLGRVTFQIHEILVTPGASPWSGYTTFAELVADAAPDPEVTLQFLSPTAFNLGQKEWGKQFHIFPEPKFVFESLLRTWNAFSPFPLPREPLIAYVTDHVVVKRYALESKMLHYPRHYQVGFMGSVTYGLMADDDEVRRQLNALADFAFYAGVGYHTTMGMGQTRRVLEGNDHG